MKSFLNTFLRPSLFRRYWVTTLVLIGTLFSGLSAWAYFTIVSPDSANDDLTMLARSFALISEGADAAEAKRQGELFRRLHREFSPVPKSEIADVQYALYRGGSVTVHSDQAPLAIFDTLLADLPQAAVARGEWFVRVAVSEKSGSVAIVAIRQRFFVGVRKAVLSSTVGIVLVYMMIATVMTWVTSRFALRPVRDLSKRILALDQSRFGQLSVPTSYAELTPVIEAINHRTAEINHQVEMERVFFSNAAHELRTPLAVIHTQAFSVERANSTEERTARIADLQNGVKRAAHALGRMLHLARLDSVAVAADAAYLPLGDVVAECVAFHAARAFTREQTISLTESQRVVVFASRDDLVTIVDNLVENAINYAGEGATISVEVGLENADTVYLRVVDDGPGFSAEDHATAFERFRRGSQAEQHSGSGLGLAIVKAAAERIGGCAMATTAPAGRGLCIQVLLPIAKELMTI
jgi:signal transduction histidine kinase